jgi:hypothetical protein
MSAYAEVFDHPGVQRLSVGYRVTEKRRTVYVLPTEQGVWSLFEGPDLGQVLLGQGPDNFATPLDAVNRWSTWMETW